MSAQEFKPGDRVRFIQGEGVTDPSTCPRTLTHLPDAPEPEDKADLYVEPVTAPSVDNSEEATEPEPLKEDQDVLIWARVKTAALDCDGEIEVALRRPEGLNELTTYTLPDAIVRPDAGQVPPWVKPAVCPSLHHVEGEGVYIRCESPEGHVGVHGAGFSPGFRQWSGIGDAITVTGGAS